VFLFHAFFCVSSGVSQYAAFENPEHAAPPPTTRLRLLRPSEARRALSPGKGDDGAETAAVHS